MINTIQQTLQNSFSYTDYRKLATELVTQGKSTGHEQSNDLFHYSELNEVRMNRLEKTITITNDVKTKLENLDKNYIWLVLAESWCGDAAQILPVIYKMSQVSEKITLKIALRDDNDILMQQFLSNGSRSIPKLIVLAAETLEIIADWGPRPNGAKQLIIDYKTIHGVVDENAKIALQKWYLLDKGSEIQNEIVALFESILA